MQHYDWGDPEFIPTLLGVEPDGRPWAELWLGTHPNGPASLDDGTPLAALTGELPYLLKVLAAARPLSLQTHPDRAQAEIGFRDGRYPDPNPKPELLCALTPFEALCGVRPVDATLALLDDLGAADMAEIVRARGPGPAIEALYRGGLDAAPVVAACAASRRPEAEWVSRLDTMYPGQPSVAVTILLNLVVLAPGEAIRLGAGNLHAYLGGCGIELMGASDNVVRGGLTTKHVDVDELLTVVDPTPLADPVMPADRRYPLDTADVVLVRLEPGHRHRATSYELTVGVDGGTWLLEPGEDVAPDVTTYVVVLAPSSANP